MKMHKNKRTLRTYWRDSANPFPGRLLSERTETLSTSERAWLEYVRQAQEERDARAFREWQAMASKFEALADQTCEDYHD